MFSCCFSRLNPDEYDEEEDSYVMVFSPENGLNKREDIVYYGAFDTSTLPLDITPEVNETPQIIEMTNLVENKQVY